MSRTPLISLASISITEIALISRVLEDFVTEQSTQCAHIVLANYRGFLRFLFLSNQGQTI